MKPRTAQLIDKVGLHRLYRFWVFGKSGGFIRASRVLGINKPVVRDAVVSLERDLGVSLYTRHGNQCVLTEKGRQLRDDLTPFMIQIGGILAKLAD